MTATIFIIADASRKLRGLALICPAARYASVRWRGADRLDRRFATPQDWRALEIDLRQPPPTPWPPDSAVVRVLGVGRDAVVQYQTARDVEAETTQVTVALDTLLNTQPLEPPRLSVH